MTFWLVSLMVLFVNTTLSIEKTCKENQDEVWHYTVESLWNYCGITPNPPPPPPLPLISAFFYTEDIFSFFCHLLSPSLSAQKFGLDKNSLWEVFISSHWLRVQRPPPAG